MSSAALPPGDSPELAVAGSVAAFGVVEATPADISALREDPGEGRGRPVPPRFLRFCDEQTVAGLAAVLRAIDGHGMEGECFDDWGVLAAPQFFGRIGGAAVFEKFRRGGPSTVSPHAIPQISLHSLSSAISIALGMRGLNFGIGGGPEALAEGFAAALSFLDLAALPGLWLVLTEWTPEPTPDGKGSILHPSICRAVALALVSGASRGISFRWECRAKGDGGDCHDASSDAPGESRLAALAGLLRRAAGGESLSRWSCRLPWGGRVELTPKEQQRQSKAA